jgi:hypothetical protein
MIKVFLVQVFRIPAHILSRMSRLLRFSHFSRSTFLALFLSRSLINEINEIDETNEINEIDQTDEIDEINGASGIIKIK